MNILVPPIVRPISLSEYAPEMGAGPQVWVWVNPTRAFRQEYDALTKRRKAVQDALKQIGAGDDPAALIEEYSAVGQGLAQWYAQLWSQHSDPASHWTREDVLTIANNEDNPALYGWLCRASWRLIAEYRTGQEKKTPPPSKS